MEEVGVTDDALYEVTGRLGHSGGENASVYFMDQLNRHVALLQKFRGELQMLDARGQGGEGGSVGYSGGGRGSDFGQSSPNEGYSRGGGGSQGGGGTSRELDDEIPF